MSDINLTLSADRMEARLTIRPGDDPFPTREELEHHLEQSGVVYGIDQRMLTQILEEQKAVENRVMARGSVSTGSNDDRIIWYITKPGTLALKDDDRGRVDYKQQRHFQYVHKGFELASKLPSSTAEGGKTVTGDPIASAGASLSFAAGKNTEITEDGLSLRAARDGFVFWKNDRIMIDEIYQVDGDVDFHTGNIKFNGSILIHGDVKSGFRVEGNGDIHIKGTVDAATIYSSDGNVYIDQGVLGKQRGKILAEGSVYCGFIQDASVSAKHDITIDRYLMNCRLSAGGKVIVTGERGLIRGGQVFAEDGIEANEVGGQQNIPTEIGLSSSELREVAHQRETLQQALTGLLEKLHLAEKKIDFLHLLEDRLGTLTDSKKDELTEASREISEIEKDIEKLKSKDSGLSESLSKPKNRKIIRIYQTLFRGVHATIGNVHMEVNDGFENVKIYLDGDTVQIEPIRTKEK